MSLPDLNREKNEEDIIKFSPRKFILGTKEFTSYALNSYQYRMLLNHLINVLKKYSKEELEEFGANKKKNLIYADMSLQPSTIPLELIILSCCDNSVSNLLLKVLEIQEQFNIIEHNYKFLVEARNIFETVRKAYLYFKLSCLHQQRTLHQLSLDNKIRRFTNVVTFNQWNIAFNYIVEQNDLIETALALVKKNKQVTG
jgi:hypothetical protein